MVPRLRSSAIAVAVVALLAGAVLFVYGRWSAPAQAATAAAAAGEIDTALKTYADLGARFKRFPVTQQVLADDRALIADNHLALLYRQQRWDDVIDVAVDAPPEASPHFWAGCAFFKKGLAEKKEEAQLEFFTRAEDEFKLALGTASTDWDTKFNYELSARVANALRPPSKGGKEQKSVPSSLMQLLRPQQQQQQQQRPVKKVG